MSYADLFSRCVNVILQNEGGYVNHPADPGGETNFGICKRAYPLLNIKNLTKEDAIGIYLRDYWQKMNLMRLNNETFVLHLFDMGVNAGPRTAIKIAQRLVNTVPDGVIGEKTIRLFNEAQGIEKDYILARQQYYLHIVEHSPDKKVFLKGWLNRIDHCKF